MSYENPRIHLHDDFVTIVLNLSEGNPGAIRVCIQLFQQSEKIDPDCMIKGLGPLLELDVLDLYGTRVWLLYKDVCGEDLVKMAAVLRATQLGLIRKEEVLAAVSQPPRATLNLDEILSSVRKRLPRFGKIDPA